MSSEKPTLKPQPKLDELYKSLPLPPEETQLKAEVRPKPIAAAPIKQKTAEIPDVPLVATSIETPRPSVKRGPPWLRDVLGLAGFIAVVIIGTVLINTFIFRSFNVVGPSMEPTLEGGVDNDPSDRLIVNRLPITIASIAGKQYVPDRGQIIVFQNPKWSRGQDDEFVVKRVIGLPGERVTVSNCELRVYNSDHPDGFNPYPDFKNLASNDKEYNGCVEGSGTDVTVPDDEIFVVGDHREGSYSMDSRNGDGRASLGTIPLENIVGPVTLRIWPFDKITSF